MLLSIPTYILCGDGAEDGDEHAGYLGAFQFLNDSIVLRSASKTSLYALFYIVPFGN